MVMGGLKTPLNKHSSTRMAGIDQIVWNLTNDQDLFCIWGFASIEEPLRDDLIKKTLEYLIKTVPILNCKPVVNWFYGTWQFIKKDNVKDLIVRIKTISDNDALEQLHKTFSNPMNAKDFSMIRIISIDGPSKHYFVIQVHHVVVDGEGLKRICVKFAQIYKELYMDKDFKPDRILDPCRSWWQIAKNLKVQHLFPVLKISIINIYAMFVLRLQNKTAYSLENDIKIDEKTDAKSQPYFESVTIERAVMAELKAFTKQGNVTVNDVLMSSFALATLKWNKDHGDDRDWLRFGYTANLRRWWGEPRGTFGNFSIVLLYEENNDNLLNPSIALKTIKSKIDRVKKTIGLDGFVLAAQLKLIPYVLVRKFSLLFKEKMFEFIGNNHAMTNIGIVFEEAGDFGHTKAIDYSLLAPTFENKCIIYTITTFQNKTTIHLGSNQGYLDKESAKSFLLSWKQMIQKTITDN